MKRLLNDPVGSYVFAIAICLLMLLARYVVHPFLGTQFPFTFLFFAPVITAIFTNWKAATFASIFCYILGQTFFAGKATVIPIDISGWIGASGYFTSHGVVIWATEHNRKALRELEKRTDLLSVEVVRRQEIEASLRAGELRYSRALDASRSLIYELDVKTGRVHRSKGLYELTGFTPDQSEQTMEWWTQRIHPEDRYPEGFDAWLVEVDGDHTTANYRVRHRDGRWIEVQEHCLIVRDGNDAPSIVVGNVIDVSERRNRERQVVALNHRLKRAMRETHHRVKNNLQIIAAMAQMYHGSGDTVPVESLDRIGQQVKTLAKLHDLLTWQVGEFDEATQVDARLLFERLEEPLRSSSDDTPITFDIESICIPISQSAALCVLANELVSNAGKHGGRQIDIILRSDPDSLRAILEVRDRGKGFPDPFNPKVSGHVGMELIDTITRIDLRGKVELSNRPDGGASVQISFPIETVTASTSDSE